MPLFRRRPQGFAVLLDPDLLATLERLQLSTRRPLAGQLSGGHRSKRYGTSLDFADFREYQPGDDFRRIDYLTLARLDQLLIRLYDAEDDLVVRLVVDTSASMGFDGKLRRATQVAAAIGFVALTRRDAVTVHTSGRVPVRFRGRGGWHQLQSHLEQLVAEGQGSLVSTAAELLGRSGPPGLTVLCSDLLDPEWESALRRLPARGADLVVAHVLGAGELRPDIRGDVDLVDSETGERVAMSGTPSEMGEYQGRLQQWLAQVQSLVRGLGAGYVLVDPDADLRNFVLGEMRRSQVLA